MPESASRWFLRHEIWLVWIAGMLAFMAIPLSLGYMGISWDAVNHHFYLGWTAEHPRFDLDYIAAGYQSYQLPYLYWPVYKLAMAGASGMTAGVVLALLHATAVPPIWMISRACIPEDDLFAAGMRAAGVLLAFMSGAVLSMFDTTGNDLMAAIPLLWAYAIALKPIEKPIASARWILGSGVLAGVAVAFKLSNGFIALAMPVLWLWPAGAWHARLLRCFLGGAGVLAGLTLVYGYWGWELWIHYGSPVYPLFDGWFDPVRQALGWHR